MKRMRWGGVVLLLWGGMIQAGEKAHFVDATQAAGIAFRHQNGAQGLRFLPETYGSGLAFLDYDGDGWLDLYFVNSGRLPGLSSAPRARNALYRSQGNGTFLEATQESGTGDEGYGMGVAVGDYDNDGDPDLYVTNYGPNVLYRNDGEHFAQVGKEAGVDDRGWGSSAAFADPDLDGDLDLFVGNYLNYPDRDPLVCYIGNTDERLYCDPRKFPGQVDRLYINRGAEANWSFADQTQAYGLASQEGKELGVVWGDYDNDGDPDLYLANDMAPNMLYRNDGERFVEQGLASATGLSDEGRVEAGMGVDMGDADGDGWPDLFVTNFQWESNRLYRNLGGGFFADATIAAGINVISMAFLGFGTGFLDYDNDADLDLFVANGHVYDNAEQVDRASTYAQRNQLLENLGKGRFAEVRDAGPGLELVEVSRGAALGDYDNDGDPDIALNNSNGPARLLCNDGDHEGHWLGLKLKGKASNRDGIGALVRVRSGGQTQVREARSGASYLSAHDLRLLFGLGAHQEAEWVEIRWPSGRVQRLQGVAGGRYAVVEEELSR